jgi:N-acetylglucosaminyldiphosphoundecaprenol N-acetyl-beta-D-mannosaminyltransferase
MLETQDLTKVRLADPARISILSVPVHLVTMNQAVSVIVQRALTGEAQFVCMRDVHGIMLAQKDPSFLAVHRAAGLVLPDGMPLVWTARARGHRDIERVPGTDLMDALCAASVPLQLRHYFYGGKPGTAEALSTTMAARYKGLIVAGTSTPPFGDIPADEERAFVDAINAARPHIVWVGLSTPLQEHWMHAHVREIRGATLIGVGAAFDFQTGAVKRAPLWMQRNGLEWLHRLISEPRRLWRRYLVMAPHFLFLLAKQRRDER